MATTYLQRLKQKHHGLPSVKLHLLYLLAKDHSNDHIIEIKEAITQCKDKIESLRVGIPLCLFKVALVQLELEKLTEILSFMEKEMQEAFQEEEALSNVA